MRRDHDLRGSARQRGWGAAGKVIVLGIMQRNGQVMVFSIPAREGKRVIGLIRAHTKPGSLYYNDDWQAHGPLRIQGDHIVIRKERGRSDLFPLLYKKLRTTGMSVINPVLVRVG